jgi:hypothetical protein
MARRDDETNDERQNAERANPKLSRHIRVVSELTCRRSKAGGAQQAAVEADWGGALIDWSFPRQAGALGRP